MSLFRQNISSLIKYLIYFVKWIVLSVVVGAVGGVVGSVFHICIDSATHLRDNNTWILFLMPVGGLFIVLMYKLFARRGEVDTNLVIASLRSNTKIPLVMVPLIFISTVVTQLVGASGGREGAALQLGGSIGCNFGGILGLKSAQNHIITMSGMAAVFSALFGTPLTAAIFSLEVATVGLVDFTALFPCIVSSISAFSIAQWFGIHPVRFALDIMPSIDFSNMARVIILALLCALVSILFCAVIEGCRHITKKLMPNDILRVVVISLVLVGATLLVGSYDYNGAGMFVIDKTMQTGFAKPEAFILKLLFTALSLSAGFKGGEIVPAFFVGSTFGAVMGSALGINPVFAAAIGFVCLFCGVVNCPIASIILSIEVFGIQGLLFFAIACAVSYSMSGKFGLYSSQTFAFSKTDGEMEL